MTGIVPQFCGKMLKLIEERSDGSTNYEVHLSMLEIYNEVVRDLLNPSKNTKGLKVREHPKSGFYGTLLLLTRPIRFTIGYI